MTSRSNSLLLTPLTVAACLVFADSASAQKGPHTSMGRPGLSRPAKPEKPPSPKKSEDAKKSDAKAGGNAQAEKNPAANALANHQKIEELSTMTPEQRQKALGSLPPGQQKHLEDLLGKWQQMTPDQRQKATARLEKLQALPPDEQKQVRQAAQAFQQLPDDRKRAINQEMGQLRKLTTQQREARTASPEFKGKFSSSEQDMVKRRLEVLPENTPAQNQLPSQN